MLASRLGGLIAPLDGVTTDLSDPAISTDDARYARALGFGGKLTAHISGWDNDLWQLASWYREG